MRPESQGGARDRQHPVTENSISNAGPMSREAIGLVARTMIAGIVLGVFFEAEAQIVAPVPDVGAESPEVAKAFSRLDALADELSELRRPPVQADGGDPPLLGPIPALEPPSTVSGPRPAPSLPSAVRGPSGTGYCGSLEEITETIKEVEERYDGYSVAIVEVNSKLPGFREGMLDPEHICERRFGDDISYEISRLKELAILGAQQHVGRLGVCVDRLRRDIEDKMSEENISTIRLQRLVVLLARVKNTNDQTINLDRSLLRGISKRDRLVQELEHFYEEIKGACP